MDLLLTTVKVMGLLFSGLFGLLGTVHDFREADGKYTRWGKVAIGGILVSVLLAVVAQLMEAYLNQLSAKRAALQALDATEKLESIVNELTRSLHPIDSVSAFVAELQVPVVQGDALGRILAPREHEAVGGVLVVLVRVAIGQCRGAFAYDERAPGPSDIRVAREIAAA